jgi:hypothetical protein
MNDIIRGDVTVVEWVVPAHDEATNTDYLMPKDELGSALGVGRTVRSRPTRTASAEADDDLAGERMRGHRCRSSAATRRWPWPPA